MNVNELESRLERLERENRMMKRVGLVSGLTLLFLAAACSRSLPTGEVYESLDGASLIRVQSGIELDIREATSGSMLVAKFSIEDDDRVRVVLDVLGTPRAVYYEITEDGLEAPDGAVLYSSGRIEEARQQAELARQRAAAEEKARREAETEGAFSWLTENKAKLDGLRAELDEVKAMREAAPQERTVGAEALTAKAEELDKRITKLADEFNTKLASFLNDPNNSMIEGEPLTDRQQVAIRMKSSEEMKLASEYIERGGDYRRAIDILALAVGLDPGNSELKAALEVAQANQYVTEKRFSDVRKGMTQDQVREILGQVNLRNTRRFDERGVVAWFYPTAAGGSAAAVFFQKDKKSGVLKVYQFKFEAVG